VLPRLADSRLFQLDAAELAKPASARRRARST